ncbi:hypothetical protein GGR35_001195 [Mucilaginibacter phyllosphaerae]|uniref:Uncharacterized protein n=1 Tax=Mucilaginibacter phyllosphaerae TaxID=1812349 RepID=A0ABR6I6D4_9SPHI|nr:hypothetical protein [Mucilaginibacter phyllosphaerae]
MRCNCLCVFDLIIEHSKGMPPARATQCTFVDTYSTFYPLQRIQDNIYAGKSWYCCLKLNGEMPDWLVNNLTK